MSAVAGATADALRDAHQLVDLGVPVFTCRITDQGDPIPPKKWEQTEPSHDIVDSWRPGLGLCAVTGIKFDVLDMDPRHGGQFSIKRMAEELGESGPDIYWRVRTPSGGLHLWVFPLGIGSHNGFVGGLDLKGGRDDGESRGFVFLPPSVRPSKEDGVPRRYVPTTELQDSDGDRPCRALRRYVEARLAEKASQNGSGGNGSGRIAAEVLAEACRQAEAGDQRTALLRYVHELERRGYDQGDILRLLSALAEEMPTYDIAHPWRLRDLRGLLHAQGRIIGDAAPGELDGMMEGLAQPMRPLSAGLVRSVAELTGRLVEWGWPGYIAIRELTIVDGEKARGKTMVCYDVLGRWSNGRAMPGQPEAVIPPSNAIIFGDEGHIESITLPQLRAAGADLNRIKIPGIKVPKRGDKNPDWELALPGGAALMARMIAEAGATIALFDPVTDFLDETIQTHNDASVRRALRPLAIELARIGCAGLAIRHMNKQVGIDARYRGSGSTAFQNRARVHLVIDEIPITQRIGEVGKFGLAMVDSNLAVRTDGALTYDIVDSDIQMDDLGNMVGKVKWWGYAEVDILSPKKVTPGPQPSADRLRATEILTELFSERDTWSKTEVEKELANAGIKLTRITLDKIRDDLGIRSIQIRRRGVRGVRGWSWTTRKPKIGESEEDE